MINEEDIKFLKTYFVQITDYHSTLFYHDIANSLLDAVRYSEYSKDFIKTKSFIDKEFGIIKKIDEYRNNALEGITDILLYINDDVITVIHYVGTTEQHSYKL